MKMKMRGRRRRGRRGPTGERQDFFLSIFFCSLSLLSFFFQPRDMWPSCCDIVRFIFCLLF